jgi:hypothetical protein
VHIHEGLSVVEKRLSAEAHKQVQGMKEQLSLYEGKRRDRDKYRERVRSAPAATYNTLTTQTPQEIAQRRSLKMRDNEESLALQSKRLHSCQVNKHTLYHNNRHNYTPYTPYTPYTH